MDTITDADAAKAAPAESTKKFALLVGLGIITVPPEYVHGDRLRTFVERGRSMFSSYDNGITDENFPNPTRILMPGDRLFVRAFVQVVEGLTSSEERLAFLATQSAIHTGAQGLSLVFDQGRDLLPKGKRYASFDRADRLWAKSEDHHMLPWMHCCRNGEFEFDLGNFEGEWCAGTAFLCFSEA